MDSSKQYNLSVFCKIKLNNLQSNDPRSKTHEKRSISPIRSKSPIKQTGDQQMHNIFTPNSENETPKIVVASENPIKQKFINSYFRTERDLFNYRNTILKNAKIFNYDGVFDQSYSQELLYKILYKDKVCNLINGLNSTFFFYGPQSSGKSYILRGADKQERGILIQAAEDLLNLIEISLETSKSPKKTQKKTCYNDKKFQLLASVYCVCKNDIFDLLSKQKITLETEAQEENELKIKKITNYEIRFISEFKNLYRLALNNHKSMAVQTKNPDFRQNSHLIINFTLRNLQKNDSLPENQINFIRLADSNRNSFKNSLCNDFNSLGNLLIEKTINQNSSLFPYSEDSTLGLLANNFFKIKNEIIFMILVSDQSFQESKKALKFCSQIYEKINKKETIEAILNTKPNIRDFLKDLKRFSKEINHFLKAEKNLDKHQKEYFFQKQISENRSLSQNLQNYNEEIPKEPKYDKIIKSFLKGQKVLEKIYEDFLIEQQDRKMETEKKNEAKEKINDIEYEISQVLQEIKDKKQSASLNIDISFLKKLLKIIEKMISYLCEEQNFSKEKTNILDQMMSLVKEVTELEKGAFASELTELGALKDTFRIKEELIEQFSKELLDKNEIIIGLERENEDIKGKYHDNQKKLERVLKENENLLGEIEKIREDFIENKENLENRTMKSQKKLEEDKNREIMRKKEKNKEIKEMLKNLEDQLLIKQEENKRLLKDFKEYKLKNENEFKFFKTELDVCQEENNFLKQKLEECTLQNSKSIQFEKIDKELKNSSNMINVLMEEKNLHEKKLQKKELDEEKLKEEIFQLKERNFFLEEEKKNAQLHHNNEFDSLEGKLDNFVKEMNDLKAENSKIVDMQMASNKKILKLESENEELKNENVKYRIKFESIQKGFLQNEIKEKAFKEEDKLKFKELKKDAIKQNVNDLSHRDIKQKLQKLEDIQRMVNSHKSKKNEIDLEESDSSFEF